MYASAGLFLEKAPQKLLLSPPSVLMLMLAQLNMQYTDKSSGSPTLWKWIFGDGSSSTLKNPAHTYSKAGNYTVSLTIKNDAGTNTKTSQLNSKEC